MKKTVAFLLLMAFSHEVWARPYMMVLSYAPEPRFQKQTELFTDRLREEFHRRYGNAVLSREETSDLFLYHKKSVVERKHGEGDKLFEQAKKAYFEFRWEEAQALIKKLLEHPEQDLWVEANILKGLTAFAQKRESEAADAFREVGRLDPGRTLDPKFFSPKVVRLFNKQVQRTHWSTGTILIAAEPEGAEVYVNGVMRGLAPLTLKDFPIGKHKIRIQASHYRTIYKEILLTAEKPQSISTKLVWEKAASASKAESMTTFLGFTAKEVAAEEHLVPLATEIGGEMGASKVLLVTYGKEGSGEKVTTQLIDMTLRTAHKSHDHEVAHIEERSAEFASTIADRLLEQIGKDIKMDPRKYGENRYQGDIVLIGRRPKPIYRRPIFWVFVASVAAGAALTAVLAGTEATTGAVGIAFQ